jgi:pilus assembly protein CpaB
MNRNARLLIVIVVALAAAGIASFSAYRAVQTIPVRQVEVASVQTVVAARSLPAGTLLTKDDVRLLPWPSRGVVPGSFTNPETVVNRGLVASVSENEPLTEGKLAAPGTGGGLPPTIPQGLRAISVKVNEVIGVAGFVVPGTRVDVLVSLTQGDLAMSRTVVSNVQVLTAGTRYDQDQAQAERKPIPTTVVTLVVTPEDAERIALASNQGHILLTLRNPLDTDPTKTDGIRLAALLGAPAQPPVERVISGRKVLKAAAPSQPEKPNFYTVEAIRAAKRSEEVVR